MDVKRVVAPLVILVLVGVAAFTVFGSGDEPHRLTAYFPRTVSLYEGSEVRVLGVPVGKVDKITPDGTRVKVEMTYEDDIRLPKNAKAMIISPAVVGDRYVQITPAYSGGPELSANAVLESSSEVPIELDEVYSNLDRLTVALGPDGANSEGALTDLLEVTARNFGGQGNQFNQTIENFGRLSATLDDNKDELFGAAAELQKFITTLADNDQTVRDFNSSLGRVSTLLADERQELAGSLKNLAVALDEVARFVKDNRDVLKTDIKGLNRVAKVLVKQRDALSETLRTAPLALSNLALTYNPDTGTLDTNANVGSLLGNVAKDPKLFLCSLLSGNDPKGTICDLVKTLPLPRTAPFGPGTGTLYTSPSDASLGGIVPAASTSGAAR
jgi:phospholipid/cholesterol/gamma-HCH transport system substrate-binding protein